MSSWWLSLSREQFSRELETRFAVNKADPPSRGMAAKWSREASQRGGQQKKRIYVSHAERMQAMWQRKKAG